jgi:hypothetical protein
MASSPQQPNLPRAAGARSARFAADKDTGEFSLAPHLIKNKKPRLLAAFWN